VTRRPSIIETLSDRAFGLLALLVTSGAATIAEVLLP
jgi:hypothetical protein